MTDTKSQDLKSGNWFADLIMAFKPDEVQVTGTPAEMTHTASWEAFSVSTVAGLPPGFFGWLTILPEIIAVTKIQINLIYKIAKYYDKVSVVNPTFILLIFCNDVGIATKGIVHNLGKRMIVRTLGSKALRPLAQKVGAMIGVKITQRVIGRTIPFLLAPVFGVLSKSLTTQIGKQAEKLFSKDIEVETEAE